jgi:hypoxanthine phosphoribosyltransferase
LCRIFTPGGGAVGRRLVTCSLGRRAFTIGRVKPLLSEDEIRRGVERLADEIGRHYAGRSLTILGVLTGSLVLVADLIRRLDLPLRIGVIQTRSYRGADTRPGKLEIVDCMLPDIRGRDVLLVDDIFDTGRTLAALVEQVKAMGPRSVRSAVLLIKEGRQEVAMRPDHAAFTIPNAFVVGYGLDYQDAFRHLPYVAMLEDHDLAAGPSA